MQNKKIAIVCPYPFGVAAGQRLKYEQYFDHWVENNFDIKIYPFMSENLWAVAYENGFFFKKIIETIKGYFKRFFLLFQLSKFDIVYVHQWTTPYGTSLYDIFLRIFSKKLIFDLEDFVVIKDNGIRSTSK
ncbi:MAG: hypothetical protein ACJ0QO_04415, partial [Parvicellaceae bacterium]